MSQPRIVQPSNRSFIVLLVAAIIVSVGIGVGNVTSANEPFIIVVYIFGVVTTAIAWGWDVRGKGLLYVVGVLALGYSLATMLLTAQYWLLVGAFVLAILGIGLTALLRLNNDIERNR
ncbi:MAG TPA: hypothetical protein VJO13_04815 [Ktedonobacterales bacterium]|nr:hypothetical protein [Ktedonobacterales bacterium]